MKEELGGERLISAFFLASRQMRLNVTRNFAEYGIAFEQLEVLFLLKHNHEMSVSQIAAELEKDKATVSRSIRFLELRGLVQKKTNTNDKRKLKVTLSNEGIAKLDEVRNCHHELIQALDDSVSPKEQKIFLQILGKIVDIFCEDDGLYWQKINSWNHKSKDIKSKGKN